MTQRFQGMIQIVRFNPSYYGAGAFTLLAGTLLLARTWNRIPPMLSILTLVGLVFACWWLLASLVVSHLVYDRSDWPRGAWLTSMIGKQSVQRVLNVHCGFDESTMRLRAWLPEAEVVALDLFDSVRLTETSIHRARAFRPPLPGTLQGAPERWPVEPASFDVVCFLLSAHEYRSSVEREALFQRAREGLRPGGCVLLAEHVRDPANFAAFGPGFLHFHSSAAWRRAWTGAGLQIHVEQRVTPWLSVWCLQSNNS